MSRREGAMDDASIYSTDYYRGRERAERELADQAASIAIRNIHLNMANRYRELAQDDQVKRTRQDRGLPPDGTSNLDGEQARG